MLRVCFASRAAAAVVASTRRFHVAARPAASAATGFSAGGGGDSGGDGAHNCRWVGGAAVAALTTALLCADWGRSRRPNTVAAASGQPGTVSGHFNYEQHRDQQKRRRRVVVAAPIGQFDSGVAKRPTSSADAGDSRSLHKSGLTRSGTAALPLAAVTAATAQTPQPQTLQSHPQPPPVAAEEASTESGELDIGSGGPGSVVTMSESTGLPSHVPYLIIGSGFAGMAAARAIRASDPMSKVLIIGEEPYPPYLRPPLSKELWRRKEDRVKAMLSPLGDMRRNSWLFVEPESFFIDPRQLHQADTGGVSLWTGRRAVALDVAEKCVTLDSGDRVQYGKCLLATGGRPRNLPVFEAAGAESPEVASRTVLFRGIADFQSLLERAQRAKSVMVVGGGFLGCELAVSLAEVAKRTGLQVHHVFKEPGALSHVLPPNLAEHTAKFIAGCGVAQHPGDRVANVAWDPEAGAVAVALSSGQTVSVDLAVVAVGIEPNTQLAESAGLELDPAEGGFLVNAELEARADLFAAGDACSYYDLLLGRRRVEHVNHAEESGAVAGRNMAAEAGGSGRATYQHQSSFWCNLANTLAWDAVGLVDSGLETQAFFAYPPDAEEAGSPPDYQYPGVVFYIKAGRVVGILLWNLPDEIFQDKKAFAPSRLNLARKVLAERQLADPAALMALAREFDVYQTIDDDYQDLKKYMEAKEAQQQPAAAAAAPTGEGAVPVAPAEAVPA